MFRGAVLVVAQKIEKETNQRAKGDKE